MYSRIPYWESEAENIIADKNLLEDSFFHNISHSVPHKMVVSKDN